MRRARLLTLGFLATVLLAVGAVVVDQRQVCQGGERAGPAAAETVSPGGDPFGGLR